VKLLTGLAAAGLVASSFGPSLAQAQTSPLTGSWTAGPDGAGSSTIVGRIEAPRAKQNVFPSSNLLVTGWAADTSAAGWAGIDGVEVWSGVKSASTSTKLATGSVGLARADIGDALGGSFTNSGFSAVVPSSALSPLTGGAENLYVYLHTPGRGTWYRTIGINLSAGAALAFPNDPIVVIARPQEGMNITQKQKTSKFSFNGWAIDRNPITNPAQQTLGPGCSGCGLFSTQARGAGIASVTLNMDTPKGDPIFPNFGAPCPGCVEGIALVSNLGSLNVPGKPQASIQSRQYGSAFDFSGWSASINPTTLAAGPHTLYVTATSFITPAVPGCPGTVGSSACPGKTTTATVDFNMVALGASDQRIQP